MRCFVRLVATMGMGVVITLPLAAQPIDFPTRPVRIIVGQGPGAANDVTARLLASHMTKVLGQPVIVENRVGASGNIAAAAVARSEKDGYTLYMCTNANVTTTLLGVSSGVDFFKDFDPVTVTSHFPLLLVVHPSLNVSNVKELIELSKSKNEPLFFGSSGVNSTMHLTGGLFGMRTDTKLEHISYQSTAAAMTDLIAGRLQLMFSPPPTALPQIEAGTVKAIALSAAKRANFAPSVPTLEEERIPGFDSALWDGIVAPRGTPSAVIERLSHAITSGLESPEIVAAMKRRGADPGGGSPQDFARLIEADAKKWGSVISGLGPKK